jgi:hypothetical protein
MNRFLWFGLAFVVACSPAPAPARGAACDASEPAVCGDSSSALICRDGIWTNKVCIEKCTALGGRLGGVSCSGVGEACSGTPRFACSGAKEAAECINTVWKAIPCRGPKGCGSETSVTCDLSGSLAGDACPSTAEGKGLCTPDGKGVIQCSQGTFTKTSTCQSCTVSADQVICQP